MNEFIFDFRELNESDSANMKSRFIDSLKNRSYDGILVVTEDAHSLWSDIISSGVHIGMRGAKWNIVKDIPIITVNGVKVVFAKDEDDPKYTLFSTGKYSTNEVAILEDFEILDLKDPRLSECLKKLDGKLLGWDYETRGFPLEPGFKPLGFSLVSDDYGIYIDMRHYTDYESDDYKEIKEFIIKNQRNLITYNLRFETHCFLHMFDIWIYPLDAMAVLAADDMHTNLKAAAQMYLSVPSWDDELDFEQGLCDEYSRCIESDPEHAKEIKDSIIKRRLSIDPEADVSLYSSMDEGIGNAWEMCYPPALAKYCILDGYYTLKLYEKVSTKYTQTCLNIFHKNFYQESYLSATPMPIKVKEAEELLKNSLTINRNADLMLNRIYGELLESKYKDLKFEEFFTPVEMALIELGRSDLLSSSPDKILKELVCTVLESRDAKLLARVYGKENAMTILSSGVSLNDKRKKKIWTDLASRIGLTQSNDSVIERFNLKYNKDFIYVMEKYNELAEKLCPLKSGNMEMLTKYRRILQMSDDNLGKLGNPKLTEFFKSIPYRNRDLFLDWISPDNMNYILNCMNPKFPVLKARLKFNKLEEQASYKVPLESLILNMCGDSSFKDDLLGFSKGNFIRYKDWVPFQYACDLIVYRANKKYYDIMDNMTLYDPWLVNEDEIDVCNPDKGGNIYKSNLELKDRIYREMTEGFSQYDEARKSIKTLISVSSDQDSFRLLDLLESNYHELMGRYSYLSDQLIKYEKQYNWDIYITKDYPPEEVLDTRSLIYPLDSYGEDDESISIRHLVTGRWELSRSMCDNWVGLMNNGYLKKGYDKLTVDSGDKLFYETAEYLWIRFGTDKELSPYLFGNNGFNTKRYKVVKRTNNYAIIDHTQKGDGFEVKFNVAEKSTR